jgi:hypothetical protein
MVKIEVKILRERTQCPHCEKIIEGYTEHQVEHLLLQHIVSAHKNKVTIITKKNEVERKC